MRSDSSAKPVTALPIHFETLRPKSTAELEWPTIKRIVTSCRSQHAHVVLGWAPTAGLDSYNWLKEKSAQEGIAFNDWHPGVASVVVSNPTLSTANPHSGGHFRGWVYSYVARGFLEKI